MPRSLRVRLTIFCSLLAVGALAFSATLQPAASAPHARPELPPAFVCSEEVTGHERHTHGPVAETVDQPSGRSACQEGEAGRGADMVLAQQVATYLPLVITSNAGGGGPIAGPASEPAILSGYILRGPQPDYAIVKYRPRQFGEGLDVDLTEGEALVGNAGPYAGWDVLNTPSRGINTIIGRSDWLTISLSRAATVAIVWRGGTPLPAWLAGWEAGETVVVDGDTAPTYRRTVPAGDLTLGSVYDPGPDQSISRRTYLVLLAEADGKPSAAPAVPPGAETPAANQTCPAWVHDQYVAQGPDGKYYATWHPQIDPVYWCYFHHEHGSDPGIYRPLFGYAAAASGIEEAHAGFKVYTFRLEADTQLIVVHHFGTGNSSRAACVRYHSFSVAAVSGGELIADLNLMADHGKATHARSGHALTPSACPGQAAAADAEGSNGVRMFQVASLEPVGYEPWRLDLARTLVGISGGFTVNTPSRITDCDTLACDANVPTGDQGEYRFASYTTDFGLSARGQSEAFYTDAFAKKVVDEGTAGAVRQYVKAGTSITLPPLSDQDECYILHPFGGAYQCRENDPLNQDLNVEGALRSPN